MGIRYFETEANFILFKQERGLAEKLEETGILIRKCGNYRGLDENFFRIAVRGHEDNVRSLGCIKNIIGK